jgi:hypothetical protein
MGTDDFHNVSTTYGLDSQILANCFKDFASYLDVPKKDWNKYHTPYLYLIIKAVRFPSSTNFFGSIYPFTKIHITLNGTEK